MGRDTEMLFNLKLRSDKKVLVVRNFLIMNNAPGPSEGQQLNTFFHDCFKAYTEAVNGGKR